MAAVPLARFQSPPFRVANDDIKLTGLADAVRISCGNHHRAAAPMGNRLDGKVCVVTGAGQGIGQACAVEMARQGGKIVVSDFKPDGGQETLRRVERAGSEGLFVRCDVRVRSEVDGLMRAAAERFGGIDVLHSNAGVHETDLTSKASLEELPEEVWQQVYEVNLRATWYATRAALPYLKKSKGASIINTASISSYVAMPMSAAYCASKGGVLMLTKAMAVDLAPYRIRCNCICPGGVDTPMLRHFFDIAPNKEALEKMLIGAHLIPRLGKPEEIANLVCFLASDDSSFMTGGAYMIDAGATAWRGTMEPPEPTSSLGV